MDGRVVATLILVPLLFVPSAAVAQDPDPGQELAFEDGTGDVSFQGLGTGMPASEFMDLVSFRLHGEDVEGLEIEIGVRNIKAVPPTSTVFAGSPASGAVFEVRFKVDGGAVDYRFQAFVNPNGVVMAGVTSVPASFCIMAQGRGGCNSQRVIASVDWDQSKILVYLPKASLVGRDPLSGNFEQLPVGIPPMGAGSRLSQFMVAAFAQFPTAYTDRMPDAGAKGPYILSQGVANDRLRLRLANSAGTHLGQSSCSSPFNPNCIQDFPQVSVSPGTTSLVQVVVENGNAAKRIVRLEAGMVDPKDEAEWDVRVLNNLTVPGGEQRIVNLIVNVTGNVNHRDAALMRMKATSLGFQDEVGALRLRLVASVPPSPVKKDLFFHARSTESMVCLGGCSFGTSFWLNTLEQDALATSDAGVPMRPMGGFIGETDYVLNFRLDTPLNTDLVLNVAEPITVVARIRSDLPVPPQGSVRADLSIEAQGIGTGQADLAGGAATISFVPLADAARIPAGSTINLRVAFRTLSLPITTTYTTPEFVSTGSKVTLPVIPDPKPKAQANIPLGPAFLSLTPKGDAEEFVNPGKVKVFQVTVVNEGIQEDVVKIVETHEPEGWYVDLRPGGQYRLKPGESATFGVLVKPPGDAEEGAQGHITLNATSSVDSSALAQAYLTAIVTEGVDIEDEEDNFTADEDTAARVEYYERGSSPGFGSAAIVAAVAVALGVGRRFTRRSP